MHDRCPNRLVLLLSAILCAGPAACRQVPPLPAEPPGHTVTDALGRQVRFREPPRRIALSGKAVTMIAHALYMFPDAGRRIIAAEKTGEVVSDFIRAIDAEAAGRPPLPELTGPEAIAAQQPDVVVLKSYLAQTLGRSLETLKLPVVYVDLETPEQFYRDLRTLGAMLDQGERAEQLVDYFQAAARRVRDAVAGIPDGERRRVLVLYYSGSRGSAALNVPPASWLQTVMTEMAGGIPVWKDANPGGGWSRVSLEQVYAWDADAVFVTSYAEPSTAVVDRLRHDPRWQSLRALRAGRLHAFAGDFLSWDLPDPRWILGLTWMARKLYPERMGGVDILETVRMFYRTAYDQDDSFFDRKVRPVLRGDLP